MGRLKKVADNIAENIRLNRKYRLRGVGGHSSYNIEGHFSYRDAIHDFQFAVAP